MQNLAHAADFQFAQRVINGSDADYQEFYDRYRGKIYSTCFKMTKDVSLAEDLTQDVLIILHRKLSIYKGQSSLNTWIYRITTNTVLMYFRVSKKTINTVSIDEKLEEHGCDLGIGGQTFIDPFKCIALKEAVCKLPPGYKSVLLLHDYFGYEHKETANIIGQSMGTSKSQLFKARRATRKLLDKKGNPKLYVPAEV